VATATLLNQDARPILPSFQSKRYRLMSTVMIAEDDLLIADMLEDALVAGGYEVCGIARTVKQGIELGDRCKPDFAVLDIRLADGGLGTDIAARLHSRHGVGILYASGNSSHMGLTKDDGEALLHKPYRAGDVVRALKIVEQIVRTGEAPQPFPRGFSVLIDAAPKSGTLSDSADHQDDGIRRIRRQQAELADEYAAWCNALPETLRDSATTEALQAIIDLDIDILPDIGPPRGH
jgi:DNA-binding response OmpR family regulator